MPKRIALRKTAEQFLLNIHGPPPRASMMDENDAPQPRVSDVV
jgi:hypothetical protein